MTLGVDTHIHQRLWTKRFQETRSKKACGPHAPGLKIKVNQLLTTGDYTSAI